MRETKNNEERLKIRKTKRENGNGKTNKERKREKD